MKEEDFITAVHATGWNELGDVVVRLMVKKVEGVEEGEEIKEIKDFKGIGLHIPYGHTKPYSLISRTCPIGRIPWI
ncbi:MAG: hypothetical protein LBQ39_07300 [Tannerellaceae bacterium]|nr:hypothetical protein [Tannerellaceae bacterium]